MISYTYSFDDALDAGRLFHARFYRWYVLALGLGLLVGAILMVSGQWFGLSIALFSSALLLMARFAVMDRLFGRR